MNSWRTERHRGTQGDTRIENEDGRSEDKPKTNEWINSEARMST